MQNSSFDALPLLYCSRTERQCAMFNDVFFLNVMDLIEFLKRQIIIKNIIAKVLPINWTTNIGNSPASLFRFGTKLQRCAWMLVCLLICFALRKNFTLDSFIPKSRFCEEHANYSFKIQCAYILF